MNPKLRRGNVPVLSLMVEGITIIKLTWGTQV
jgi:hypothetical protein